MQQHKANLMLKGHTLDSAIRATCQQSPWLYAYSRVEGVKPPQPGAGTSTDGEGDKNRRAKRTAEEQLQSDKRRIEQLQRENANLKNGKGGKRNTQPTANAALTGAAAAAAAAGANSGNYPTVPCPPDFCKDFNFKPGTAPNFGCARGAACKYKHKCAVCGQDHPWKGNH